MSYIFLHSHPSVPNNQLLSSLNKVPGVVASSSGRTYTHPTELALLRDKWSSKFIDLILTNEDVQSAAVLKSVYNVFIVAGKGEPDVLTRLDRMANIYKRWGGQLLTNDDGWEQLEERLGRRIERVDLLADKVVNDYRNKFSK